MARSAASTASAATSPAGHATYELALANEIGTSRDWLGTFHLVAIYGRALPALEVAQNFVAGPDPL